MQIDFGKPAAQSSTVQGLTEKIEGSLLKIFVTTFCIILLLSAGGYFSLKTFQAWQIRRLLAEANALVNEGNYKNANLNAQRVLELNPKNADAMRVIARSAENAGLRSAIEFWHRATELSRNAEADVTAWARCAIRLGDDRSATKALDAMPKEGRLTARYHALRGDVALIRHDAAGYEKELLEAKRIDPQDKRYDLALATLHLAANDGARHDTGVRELLELRRDSSLCRDALHRLADDALRHNKINDALEYGRELDRLPNRDFSDRLLLISILKAAGAGEMQSVLEQIKADARDDAVKLSALIAWMNANRMSSQVLDWIKTLPPAALEKRIVPLSVADAFIAAGDWNGLREFCEATKWDTADYLRNALAAKALRETSQLQESTQQWNEAVVKVNGHAEQIFRLAELTRRWGWEKEMVDLWWLAAKDPVQAEKRLRMLYDFYAGRSDTAELYRVLVRLEKARPNDRAVRNNLAQVSLLLNLDPDRSYQLARAVFAEEPKNADYAATYAFALYLRGDITEARQVLSGFSEAELERPQIAAYYGMILTSSGDFARAGKFLDLGQKARLLPEEKKLVEKAQLTVARR